MKKCAIQEVHVDQNNIEAQRREDFETLTVGERREASAARFSGFQPTRVIPDLMGCDTMRPGGSCLGPAWGLFWPAQGSSGLFFQALS